MSAAPTKKSKVTGRIDCYNTLSQKPVDFSFLGINTVNGLHINVF